MMTTEQAAVPSLIFHTGKLRDQLNITNISDLQREGYTKTFKEIGGKQCSASMHGWLIMEDMPSKQCILWNPDTREVINIPPYDSKLIDNRRHRGCILLAPPTKAADCMVMIWVYTEDYLLFWRLGDEKWTKTPYELLNNGTKVNDHLCQVIVSTDGHIYGLTTQADVAVIDIAGVKPCGILSVRLLGVMGPECLPQTPCFNSHFLEFCGNMFYVAVHFTVGKHKAISHVEVFQREITPKQVWSKLKSIGDLIFCLSHINSVAFCASGLGMKANTIYITRYHDNSLYEYSLEDERATVYDLKPPAQVFQPFWRLIHNESAVKIHSDDKSTTTKEERCSENIAEIGKMKETSTTEEKVNPNAHYTSKLPVDILRLIAMRLPLPIDFFNFRLACKAFAMYRPTIRWINDPNGSIIPYPWLLHCKRTHSRLSRTQSRFRFLDPSCNFTYCIDIPELLGPRIWFSKDGWLLLSNGGGHLMSLSLFNPFSKVTVKLPDLPREMGFSFSSLSFSAPPTSPDCIIFGIYSSFWYCRICFVRLGEHAWTILECGSSRLALSKCNPVFHHGAFYCLGNEGDIGIFDPKSGVGDWKVHKLPIIGNRIHHSYLVESNGELISIFICRQGKWVRAYRLDSSNMCWRPLNTLEDQMVFLSHSSSLSLKAAPESMRNKICFPLSFDSNNNYLFYSMETRKWNSSVGYFVKDDTYNSKELQSTWIQPTLKWNDIS